MTDTERQTVIDAVLDRYKVIRHAEQMQFPFLLNRDLFITYDSYEIEINDIAVTFRRAGSWSVIMYINTDLMMISLY